MFEVKNENSITHIYFNGVDLSEKITSFELKQKGGEFPELIIRCTPDNMQLLLKKVEKLKIQEEK